MSTEVDPETEVQFPDDAPENLRTLTNPEYENHILQRIHRTVSEEPRGGALWLAEDEAVRVMKYTDSWAVEAPPLRWKVPDYAGDDADECLHFLEYEMDAELALSEQEAYRLADAYMRGEADLTGDAWWVGGSGGEQASQQTLDDITT